MSADTSVPFELNFHLDIEREPDGRYLVEVSDLAGVMAYGLTEGEAVNHALSIALRVVADRIEHGEAVVRVRARRVGVGVDVGVGGDRACARVCGGRARPVGGSDP